MTKAIPSDPLLNSAAYQWHLIGTWGLHAEKVWKDYTGSGIRVAIIDDGFDYRHADLSANYRTDLDKDMVTGSLDAFGSRTANNHGTSVLGVIAADDNGIGSVGVAFDAQAYGIRMGFSGNSDLNQNLNAFRYALATKADVINNSWGYTSPFSDTKKLDFTGTDFIDITNAMKELADLGRDGLGTNIVFAAGNSRANGDNANYHNLQNSIYSITVAAIGENGVYSPFSNQGANILVSAAGQNVITTDRSGVDGYFSSDYVYFSGTSAAAPVVSGLVALMLEANSKLGWRDVQEILAYSAQFNDSTSAGWHYNGAKNWNGGGLHFSHDYGFGAADAFTAVRLAESWELTQTSANMTTITTLEQNPNIALNDAGSITVSMSVLSDITLEHVILDLDIDSLRVGDLKITLISPTGMESVLIDRPSNGTFTGIYGSDGLEFDLTSVAYWGERSKGTWSLRVEDMVAGNGGSLNSWGLTFTGEKVTADNLYVYTDDFAKVAPGANHSNLINDTNRGIDTLNIAAVTSNSIVNLAYRTATIAGEKVTISTSTSIEHVYGGDGNDTLTGDKYDNLIHGGRGNDIINGGVGNDTLIGSAGNDTINGGSGNDTLIGGAGIDKLVGAGGHDTFGFTSIEGGADAIYNFTRGGSEGDYLNVTDILEGYDALTDLIADFVKLTQSASNTILSVNIDGSGTDFVNVATIYNSSLGGASAQSLIDDGTLVANHSLV